MNFLRLPQIFYKILKLQIYVFSHLTKISQVTNIHLSIGKRNSYKRNKLNE